MALQGTLDTFALPDVLRLLAATKKSGRLDIDSSRGAGTVVVSSGAVTAVSAARAPHADGLVEALFELLRFTDGSFTFDAEYPVADGLGTDVEELISGAEQILAEWREIEAVVPSLDAHVRLRRTIEGDSITIPADSWQVLATVAGGMTVGGLGDALALGEMPVSRVVRDLVELGVVELEEAPPAPEPVATPTPAVDEPPVIDLAEPPLPAPPAPEPAAEEPVPPAVDQPAAEEIPPPPAPEGSLPVARPIRARARARVEEPEVEVEERFVPIELPGNLSSMATAPSGDAEEAAEETVEESGPLSDLAAAFPGLARTSSAPTEEEAELARQLSTLSPRAAEAVRAAADATTDEEREAALDEAGEDAPINRGLLLKFLSSVKG